MPTDNHPPILLAHGRLDATFAGDGTNSLRVSLGEAQARAIAIQADGKYLIAGWSDSGGGDLDATLMRINGDGRLDTTFGDQGRVVVALPGNEQIHDMALQDDGHIVVVGSQQSGGNTDVLVMRFAADGSLDPSFADDGILTQSWSAGNDSGAAVAIQPDGAILVAGSSAFHYAIARYDASGAPDASFAGDGVFTGFYGTNTSAANALLLQQDGRIIVAGYGWGGTGWDLAAARHLDTGDLDTSFAGNGRLLLSLAADAGQESINAIAIQADGKILLAGNTPGAASGTRDAVLLRLDPHGALDTGFGDGGVVILSRGIWSDFTSVQVQADGKIIVAGNDLSGLGNALVARYNADGSPDTTFGDGGMLTTLFASGTSVIHDLALATDGQVVAAGTSYTGGYDFGILRLAASVIDQSAMAGQAFHHAVPTAAFHDPDGDLLSFTAYPADGAPWPHWLTFDAATATLAGTPGDADFGTRHIAVTASDGEHAVTAILQLEVTTPFIEALRTSERARWNDDATNGTPGTLLTYSFMEAVPDYARHLEASTFAPMSEQQRAGVREALRQYQDVTALTFIEVADTAGGGQLRFATYLDEADSYSGYAYHPGDDQGGDVWINRADAAHATPAPGNAAHWVLLHEIGHALGLKHPGLYDGDDGPFLPPDADSHQYTVMSYHNHAEASLIGLYARGPMLYDLAALQFLYGANTASAAGDDTYRFDPTQPLYATLWDGGGIDTLDLSDFTEDSVIDLRPGAFSSLRVLLPGYEWMGPLGNDNLAIAYGTVIEHAIGGAGNDLLIGNAHDNILIGGPGNDTYRVQNPGDRIIETSTLPDEIDTVQAEISWTLGANLEHLYLLGDRPYSGRGNALDNLLVGNTAGNVLDGGVGADTLIGGAGNDVYVVDNINDVIQETSTDPNEIDTVRASVSWTLGDNLENLTLLGTRNLDGQGNDLNNRLTGNGGHNHLNGGAGDDWLDGRSGNDTLTGGEGADTFAFTTPLNALRNVDTISDFVSGVDRIFLSADIFRDIGFTGAPGAAAFFHDGAVAQAAGQRILYDSTDGALYYDADGAGALAAVQFALLSGAPSLLYSDFFVG